MPEVGERFDVRPEGLGRRVAGGQDFSAQLGVHARVAGQVEHGVGHQHGGRVVRGEEGVEQLVAHVEAIRRDLGQLVGEHVFGALLLHHLLLLLRVEGEGLALVTREGLVDVAFDEALHDAAGLREALVHGEDGEHGQLGALADAGLAVVEGLEEFHRFAVRRRRQAGDRVAKEEFGGEVEEEAREERLQVDRRAVARDEVDEPAHVEVEGGEIFDALDLLLAEQRLHHAARVLPERTVRVHDAGAEHGPPWRKAERLDTPALKVRVEDGAEVGRVAGEDTRLAQGDGLECRAVGVVLLLELEAALAARVGAEHAHGDIEAEPWVLGGQGAEGLAAMLSDGLAADKVESHLG